MRMIVLMIWVLSRVATLSSVGTLAPQALEKGDPPRVQTLRTSWKHWSILYVDGHREVYTSLLEIVIAPRATSAGCKLEFESGYIHTVRRHSDVGSSPAGAILRMDLGSATVVDLRIRDSRSAEITPPCNLTRLQETDWTNKEALLGAREKEVEESFKQHIDALRTKCATSTPRCQVAVD